jgi:hypothetical protein
MPRPNDCERRFDVAADVAHCGWARIALSSPVGLVMVAIIAGGVMTTTTPPSSAENAIVAVAPLDPDRAAVRRPTSHPVPAADLQALLSDPAVKSFKGLAEYAWDFTDPKGMPPGFSAPETSESRAPQ